MYEDLFQIAGANGFQARHTRIAGAAGLAFDFGVFFAVALGSAFGLASALGFARASALACLAAGAELEELYTRPCEDIAVEDFPLLRRHLGECKNIVDPELSKAAKDAEAQNESAFDNFASANEKKGLVDTDEYKNFCSNLVKLEKTSPLRMLIKQKHGYGYSGFYQSSVRDYENDPISAFKVQHMNWRVDVPPHAGVKYHLSEDDLFKQLCAMDALLGKVQELSSSGNPATREELLNAILRYFLSVGVDEEEVGDYHLIRCRILLSSVLDMQRMDQFLSNLVGSSLSRLDKFASPAHLHDCGDYPDYLREDFACWKSRKSG
eukprot:s1892_g8.t2